MGAGGGKTGGYSDPVYDPKGSVVEKSGGVGMDPLKGFKYNTNSGAFNLTQNQGNNSYNYSGTLDHSKIVTPYMKDNGNDSFSSLAMTWDPNFSAQEWHETKMSGKGKWDASKELQMGNYLNRSSDLETMARSLKGSPDSIITLSNGVTLYSAEEKKAAAKMMSDSLDKSAMDSTNFMYAKYQPGSKPKYSDEQYKEYAQQIKDYGGATTLDSTITEGDEAPVPPVNGGTQQTLLGISAAEGQDLTEAEKLLRAKTTTGSTPTILSGV